MCIVHFNENIVEEEIQDQDGNTTKQFEANHYSMETSYREGLLESIKTSRNVWLSAAKQRETEDNNKTLLVRVNDLESLTDGLISTVLG